MSRRYAQRLGLALSALVFSLAASGGEGFRPLKAGEQMPAYATHTLAGKAVQIGAGQPLTLVNIWATWCAPCRREFPELQQLHQTFKARGLRVLAVSVDKGSDEPVRAFAHQAGATFLIGRDPAGTVQQKYQAVGVPESFLVGTDGKLLWHKVGAFAVGAEDARAAIMKALK